ncbi:MAG: hypothetical protein NW202_13560 [Nitrospira sp.]|nr:hypothetical protein [Nitrospira sp.]
MPRYAWILIAVLGAGGGTGGFIGASTQNQQLAEDMAEIKGDLKTITGGISAGRERTALLELQVTTLSRDLEKVRAELEALKETRRR